MKRLIMIIGLLLVMCLLAPASCAKAPTPMPASAPTPTVVPAPAPMPGEEVYKESGAGVLPSAAEERMIVRTGEMSLVVEDVTAAWDEIARLAVRFNGYVVSSQIWGEEEETRGRISIRVPDDKFDQVLAVLG